MHEAHPMPAKTLSHKDFEKLVDDEFVATSEAGERLVLRLQSVEQTGEGPKGHRDPFSLIFHEDGHAHLPQQTHSVEHEKLGAIDIFLVPLGPDADGMRYEAVFG